VRGPADSASTPAASARAADSFTNTNAGTITVIAIFAAAVMHWLLINDIHLDPFDGDSAPVYAEDTNPALFDETVSAMRKTVPDAQVVIIGGDFLAHHFPESAKRAGQDPYAAGRATIAQIARKLDRAFPHAQFLIAVGNNDDPCGDYHSEAGGQYNRDIARLFDPLVDRNGAAPGFQSEYVRGGYYTANLPGGLRGVVVNSVFWSFVFRGSCQVHAHDPGGAEMSWLSSTLASGDNIIVMHEPPGYDPQSTTIAHRILAVPFLSPQYDSQLRALLSQNRSRIPFAIAAHTHRYDFRVPGGVPMLIGSSVSPIYRNNAAFFRLDVEGRTLKDVTPYSLDPDSDEWIRHPSFDAMYGMPSFSGADLVSLSEHIAADPQLREKWIEAYDVWSYRMGDVRDHRWEVFRCAQIAFGGDYGLCADVPRGSIGAIAVAGVVIIVAAVAGLIVLRRRRVPRPSQSGATD
jgi:hypothetical protein